MADSLLWECYITSIAKETFCLLPQGILERIPRSFCRQEIKTNDS